MLAAIGRLVDGQWHTDDRGTLDAKGEFARKPTVFRRWITSDGSTEFSPEAGRYHLFAAAACPWAHRVLITRALRGLQGAVSASLAHPLMLEQGWDFSPGHAPVPDDVLGTQYLWEVYVRAAPSMSGRVTVPVLWDRKTATIVNNESREIMRMFNTVMVPLGHADPDLAPASLHPRIDATIDAIYDPLNNGVYRAGFTSNQQAHERAVREVFATLDHWEQVLSQQRFMLGAAMTEADIALFTTLFRFDAVYATHFKCNLKRIVEYPNLWGFVRDVYQAPGVAGTCDMDVIKRHYFGSHESINPRRIVPLGPILDFHAPHGRA